MANLYFRLLGDLQRIVDLDAEIPDGILKFGMAEKKLDGKEIPGSPVDQRHTYSPRKELLPMVNVLTVVAKVRAAKGNGDALAALLSEQAAVVRNAEPGCLVYRLHRSTKEPELFLFYEMYVDDEAFDLHRKAPHLAAYRQRREKAGLTDGPAEVEIFRSCTE